MRNSLHRFCASARGSAAVEFAVVAPVLLILALGGLDVTSGVVTNMRLTNAAADVADLVAEQNSVSYSSIANFCAAAQLDMTPLSQTPLQIGIASVTEGSSGASVNWQDGCGGATSVPNATTVASGLIPDPGDSVIIVEASYQYPLPIPYLMSSTFTLKQTAMFRPRNNSTVTFD